MRLVLRHMLAAHL